MAGHAGNPHASAVQRLGDGALSIAELDVLTALHGSEEAVVAVVGVIR